MLEFVLIHAKKKILVEDPQTPFQYNCARLSTINTLQVNKYTAVITKNALYFDIKPLPPPFFLFIFFFFAFHFSGKIYVPPPIFITNLRHCCMSMEGMMDGGRPLLLPSSISERHVLLARKIFLFFHSLPFSKCFSILPSPLLPPPPLPPPGPSPLPCPCCSNLNLEHRQIGILSFLKIDTHHTHRLDK